VERKKVETFEDLLVWQKGIELVKQIYLISKDGKLSKDFALRDQLRGAALSIPTNIAEGFERSSRKEYLNFLNIAKGSAGVHIPPIDSPEKAVRASIVHDKKKEKGIES
jgi:hypothetical protein